MTIFSKPVARLIASGFKSGLAPFSPGTFGSAAATCVWVLGIYSAALEPRTLAGILLFSTLLLGVPATAEAIRGGADKDPSWIVIDEWAGMFLTFLIAPQIGAFGIVLAFALFRFFDIIKIGPVGWAERFPGAWGIIADDLVAGFLAALVLIAVRYL